MKALAEQFNDGKAVKKMINTQVVAGANIALAYFNLNRPNFPIHNVMMDIPDDENYAHTLGAARWMVRQVQDQTEQLVGPLEALKGEPVV